MKASQQLKTLPRENGNSPEKRVGVWKKEHLQAEEAQGRNQKLPINRAFNRKTVCGDGEGCM